MSLTSKTLALAMALVGCGSSNAQPDAATDAATAEEPTQEAAAPYPAFAVDAPQIQKNQGAVLSTPVLVTVTWPAADTNVATWEGLNDSFASSGFWAATTSEYGVGAITTGGHVHMTETLPSKLSFTDLQSYVATQLATGGGDGGTPWPAPTLDAHGNVQTVYSLLVPSSVEVDDPGSGVSFCLEGGLGWHDSVPVNGHPVPYTVSLECTSQTTAEIEETMAHEAVEAATNPYTGTAKLGYVGFDDAHLAWDLYTGYNDELADACQNWQDSYVAQGSFWIQRSWSNVAAAAGHTPCAPAPSTPYHGMTLVPSEESLMTIDLSMLGRPSVKAMGFPVTIGQALSLHVGFFSDGPTAPWTIAYDFPSQLQLAFQPVSNGRGTVSLDVTSGQNGDVATVTVTPTSKGAMGVHVLAITWDAPSSNGFTPHYLPILLVDQ